MTEYDFSPDAWERHLQTQHRIAEWVDQTEQYRPEFGPEAVQHTRPDFFQRSSHRRRSHSYHAPRRRRSLSVSSSSSSDASEIHTQSSQSPGSMPAALYQSMYTLPESTIQPAPYRSKHRHSSRRHIPVYLASQPTSPQQPYLYPYGTTLNSGQMISPGSYSQTGTSSVNTSPYSQPQTSSSPYYPTSTQSYSPPYSPPYPQYQSSSTPQAVPGGPPTYYFGQQTQPLQFTSGTSTFFPQTAAYPPTIYPLNPSYGMKQERIQQKPVFYQRIFSGSGSTRGRKSRSH